MTAPAGWRVEGGPREALRARLHALGFDEVRFAAVAGGESSSLRGWLDAGHHADLQWMERTAAKRMKAGLVLPGAQSVLVLGGDYWAGESEGRGRRAQDRPPWGRCALPDDSHG